MSSIRIIHYNQEINEDAKEEDAKEEDALCEKPLEDRKLDYVRAQSGVTPQTPSNVCETLLSVYDDSK